MKHESLFFIAWAAWLAGHIFQQSAIYMDTSDLLLKSIYVLSFILLIIYEIFSSAVYKKWDIFIFCFVFIIAMPWFEGVPSILVQGLIFVAIGRHIDFESIVKVSFFIILITTSLIILFSLLNFIPNLFFSENSGRERFSLGFCYPSRYPNFVFTMTLLAIYMLKDKCPFIWVLIPAIFSYIIYQLTGSRGPFLFTEVSLCIYTATRIFHPDFNKKGWLYGLSGLFFISAFFIIILSSIYDPYVPWLKSINDMTSNRLLYAHNAFITEEPSLLGTAIFSQPEVNYTIGYLDSSYLQLFLSAGILVFIAFLLLLTRVLIISLKNNNTYLIVCLICIALHSILEWQLTWIIYTPFLFLLFKTKEELDYD